MSKNKRCRKIRSGNKRVKVLRTQLNALHGVQMSVLGAMCAVQTQAVVTNICMKRFKKGGEENIVCIDCNTKDEHVLTLRTRLDEAIEMFKKSKQVTETEINRTNSELTIEKENVEKIQDTKI